MLKTLYDDILHRIRQYVARQDTNLRMAVSTGEHDTTQLDFVVGELFRLVETSREFNTHRRRDSTRQLSRVGIGGVYWALKIQFREL